MRLKSVGLSKDLTFSKGGAYAFFVSVTNCNEKQGMQKL